MIKNISRNIKDKAKRFLFRPTATEIAARFNKTNTIKKIFINDTILFKTPFYYCLNYFVYY